MAEAMGRMPRCQGRTAVMVPMGIGVPMVARRVALAPTAEATAARAVNVSPIRHDYDIRYIVS